MWPYGRRITTFPVWAHKHDKEFPRVIFQDEAEDNLSHSFDQSSPEHAPYCRPVISRVTQTSIRCRSRCTRR
jgi:hypothetical protein